MVTDDTPLPLLGGLSRRQFLRDYWQQQPLLVRQALPGYQIPLSPEELAGLACDEEVESRLILHHPDQIPSWQLEHGPFPEQRFATLPERHWTLLVQEVNKHVPELALQQQWFDFLPGWRRDDVMVSYAPAEGGVGPHADNYDVFLLQGYGHRRWSIHQQPVVASDWLPDLPLRILRHFPTEQSWVLAPGDLLYLPSGVAHWGVAEDPCMTLSFGFRAPSQQDLLAAYCADTLAELDPEQFYRDPADLAPCQQGEIDIASRAAVRRELTALMRDPAAIDHWFGRFATELRPGHTLPEPEQPISATELQQWLQQGATLWRSEYCRWGYYPTTDDERAAVWLFVAGDAYPLTAGDAPLAPQLCGQRTLSATELLPQLSATALALLVTLYNDGCLYFPQRETAA